MTVDIVRILGYATLGSRLKRLGEKLQAQTQELALDLAETDLPASHHPVLAALDKRGAMSVGDLAKALGQSQPGITRMINKLKSDGLVATISGGQDKRINKIDLSSDGKALAGRLKQTLWPIVALAVQDACLHLDGPLLRQLAQLEDALAEKPLLARRTGTPLPDWEKLSGSMRDMLDE